MLLFPEKIKKNARKWQQIRFELGMFLEVHPLQKLVFGKQKLSLWVTTDFDTVFPEESIGEGFKIVTVAVFEKILLLEKKNWFVFNPNF